MERDAVFCATCRQFGHQQSKEKTFTIIGYRNWKKANTDKKGFAQHNVSASHIDAVSRQIERMKRSQSGRSITELLSDSMLEKRRYYVKSIIETIVILASKRLALRGEWDVEEEQENGLFNAIFEVMVSKDPHLAACEKIMPLNATYKSPQIQNEIIDILAEMLRADIALEVLNADANFFTILFDGTKDKNGEECLSLAARFVSGGKPIEVLLFFETTTDLNAAAFTEVIIKSMDKYGLDAKRIISQCYDGASVMNGYKSGVAKRLQDYLRKIIPYVHCFNHRLHLVIVHTVSQVDAVRLFFEHIKLIYTLFKKPKIRKLYEGKSVARLLDTRWTGHLKATKSVIENYSPIVATLKEVASANNKSLKIDSEDLVQSIGLLNVITKREFVFILLFMNDVLSALGPADIVFQKQQMSYRRAMPIIDAVTSTIGDYRNEGEYEKYLKQTDDLIGDSLAAFVRPGRVGNRRRSRSILLSGFTIEETIGERSDETDEIKSIYFEIIDVILSEFKERFSENNEILLALSSSVKMDLAQLKPLEKLGIELPLEHEMKTAKTFIDTKKTEWEKEMAKKEEKEGRHSIS